jgi:hypothetical protein
MGIPNLTSAANIKAVLTHADANIKAGVIRAMVSTNLCTAANIKAGVLRPMVSFCHLV